MIATRFAGAAGLVLAVTLGLVPAKTAQPQASTALLPLSEGDMGKVTETGCNIGFDKGNKTYVFGIGRQLVVRASSGSASLCDVGEKALLDFHAGKRPLVCGGRTLRLRATGRSQSDAASDSASFSATLMVTEGKARQQLSGMAFTAC